MMQIHIELDTENAADLTALAALIISLRGDTPADFGSPPPLLAEPAVPPAPPAPPPPPASESLIEAEAARAATVPPPPPAASADVDKTGLPYDARIHSSTKAVNNDGTWRNKRNVDPALLATVTAELRAAAGPPEQQSPEAAFSPPAAAPPAPPAEPPVEQQPPAPPAPPAPAAPPPPGGLTYASLIKECNEKGKTYDELNSLAVMLGLTKFADLVKRPDLFESFHASIG